MIKKQRTIPADSLLNKDKAPFHYIDSFEISVSDKDGDLHISQMIALYMASGPKWADQLMNIRNRIGGLFALKTADTQQALPTQEAIANCQPGDPLGIFKVYAKTDKEYILGEDDKHLNFKASFLLSPSPTVKEKQVFSITTAVHFNNAMGKMYFLPVKPFHGLIIRSTLKKIERNSADFGHQPLSTTSAQ
jgi:hypothetical protein